MNKIKETYERPTTNLLMIRFEQGVLTGSVRTNSVNSGYEEENDLGDLS